MMMEATGKLKKLSYPDAYLVGHVDFMGIELIIDPRAYVPNPETESLCTSAIKYLDGSLLPEGQKRRIVDVGTGCGNIAIILSKNFPDSEIIAVDIVKSTLQLAMENAVKHGCGNINFWPADNLVTSISGGFSPHLVVANLPYGSGGYILGSTSIAELSHMPQIAIFTEGLLDAYEELIKQIIEKNWETVLMFETGLVPKNIVEKIIPTGFKWEYHPYPGYSVTEVWFKSKK